MSLDDITDLREYRGKRDGSMSIGDAIDKRMSPPQPSVPEKRPAGDKTCGTCGELCNMLHVMPGQSRRTSCAECQGKANRATCDRMSEAVRILKTTDNSGAEKYLLEQGYADTVKHLRDKRANETTKPSRGFE